MAPSVLPPEPVSGGRATLDRKCGLCQRLSARFTPHAKGGKGRTKGRWGSPQATLDARIAAVLGAQRALAHRKLGADWAFRQALVDLAAICELLAAELPRPGTP